LLLVVVVVVVVVGIAVVIVGGVVVVVVGFGRRGLWHRHRRLSARRHGALVRL
jgi:hypothetical protein